MSHFSARAIIEAMEPGATVEFEPHMIARATLTFYVTTLSKKLNRKYHSRTLKDSGNYQVRRDA